MNYYSSFCRNCQPATHKEVALQGDILVASAFSEGCFRDDFFDFSNPGFPVE
jgi:hypothetical protein